MPRAAHGASVACEAFPKRTANAIEFGGFAQHDAGRQPTILPKSTQVSGTHPAGQEWRTAPNRRAPPTLLVRTGAERLKLALELGKRARQLLASCGVCRGLQLPAELGIRQTKRLGPPQLLGIAVALRHRTPRPLFFPLVHPLLDAILRIDESFTCVCHLHLPVGVSVYQ